MSHPYPLTLLDAIEDWLNHDPSLRESRAQKLRHELTAVEPDLKRCTVPCYRRIDFPRNRDDNPRGVPLPLLDLLHAGKLAESISSWTTDPEIAKAHMEGAQTDATCIIFRHTPSPSEVWVDLSALLSSPRFQSALLGGSYPGIRSWMAHEREVILEVEHLTPNEVYSWGGFSGDVEQLKRAAEAEGHTPDEIAAMEPELKRRAGTEWWLSESASTGLALRMSEFARNRYTHPPPSACQ